MPNVIINVGTCDSGKIWICWVTMIAHCQSYFGLTFLKELFSRPILRHGSIFASFFLILMLPYWFHRLINVKHQKLVSLIMAGKGFKKSGICASKQKLYQQVPVTAS